MKELFEWNKKTRDKMVGIAMFPEVSANRLHLFSRKMLFENAVLTV